MKSVVLSGKLLSQITNLIKTLGDTLTKAFNSLADSGIETVNFKADKEGKGFKAKCRCTSEDGKSHILEITAKKSADGKTFEAIEVIGGGRKKVLNNIAEADYDSAIKSVAEEFFGNVQVSDVSQARKVSVYLSKVTSGTDIEIQMGAVRCGKLITPKEAEEMISEVVNDDAFADTVPEEPTPFSIEDCGDSYDANTCEFEPTDQVDALEEMIDACSHALAVHKALTYNSPQYRTTCPNVGWVLDGALDQLTWILVERKGSADIASSYADSDSTLDDLKSAMLNFASVMNLYYGNFEHDIQKNLDDFIREMKNTVSVGFLKDV